MNLEEQIQDFDYGDRLADFGDCGDCYQSDLIERTSNIKPEIGLSKIDEPETLGKILKLPVSELTFLEIQRLHLGAELEDLIS